LAGEHNRVIALGELVHNPVITGNLKAAGIQIITDPAQLTTDQHIIIRAHGIPPQLERELRERRLNYTDLTCPRVKKIHRTIINHVQKGDEILIIGGAHHPETIAHKGYAGSKGRVISTLQEARQLSLNPEMSYLVITQTTIATQLFEEIIPILEPKSKKLTIKNTICPAVTGRQLWIKKYAPLTEASLIIGGKNSSNSSKLYELEVEYNRAYWVEKREELTPELLQYKSMAITAGASTPHEVIQDILAYFKQQGASVIAC
jgi:4-hydroxy-3-methylbut-2-enyl diphosphate reductase